MNPLKIIEAPILFIGFLLREHIILTILGIIAIVILVKWLKSKMQAQRNQGAGE